MQKAALNASLSLVTASVSKVAPAAGAALNAVQPALKAAFDARIEGKNILAAAILNGNVETVSAMLAVNPNNGLNGSSGGYAVVIGNLRLGCLH